jgi:hypothetical protein
MKGFFLRSISLCVIFCIVVTAGYAQQKRFVYIQTENRQPFYIKLDKKILSSSAGYIIIAGLADSTYNLTIGFPNDVSLGQNVTISLKDADAGYLVKNQGEKGCSLLNLQTMQVLVPKKNQAEKELVETEPATDDFSIILASVVDDPRIARRVVMKDTIAAVAKKEVKVSDKTGVVKLNYDINNEGVNISYLDIANGNTDTVKLLLPVDPKVKDAKFTNIPLPNTDPAHDSVATVKKKAPKKNTACKSSASYSDFIALRKLMAVQENYDSMVEVARKKFRIHCYTTEQVKNLSTMFLQDEGKYKFYVAAYPFVSDINNFPSLENQLTDKAFIRKFKTLVRN